MKSKYTRKTIVQIKTTTLKDHTSPLKSLGVSAACVQFPAVIQWRLLILRCIFNTRFLGMPTSFNAPPTKLFASILVLLILNCLGLTLWQLCLISDIKIFPGNSIEQLLPNLTKTHFLLKILISKGLFINGLILILSFTLTASQSEGNQQYKSLLMISLLWNSFLAFDLFGPLLMNDSAHVLKLAHLFKIYPSSESIGALFQHSAYFLGWILLYFSLRESLERGLLHFHPHVFQFLNLAHAAYGATLLLSLITSEAVSPLVHSAELLLTLQWTEGYFFKVAVIFGLFGAFYGLALSSVNSPVFSSITFPHWFALFLGFVLVFIGSTSSQLSPDPTETTHIILIAALGLIWFSHIVYCYFAFRELKEMPSLNSLDKTVLSIALTLISFGLVPLTHNLLPTTFNHATTSSWTLSESFFHLAALTLTMAVLNQFCGRSLQSRARLPRLHQFIINSKSLLLIGGCILCILSAAWSLYFQHSIEEAAIAKGVTIDYPEVQGALQPLLHVYFWGVAALFLSVALQLLEFAFLRFTPLRPLQPSQSEDIEKNESEPSLPVLPPNTAP